MAVDPICGMTVDEGTALSAVVDGETFYFCSVGCKAKFEGGGTPPRQPAGGRRSEYTCPMHPEAVRDGPGACPICGMARGPRRWCCGAGGHFLCAAGARSSRGG